MFHLHLSVFLGKKIVIIKKLLTNKYLMGMIMKRNQKKNLKMLIVMMMMVMILMVVVMMLMVVVMMLAVMLAMMVVMMIMILKTLKYRQMILKNHLLKDQGQSKLYQLNKKIISIQKYLFIQL